MSGKINYINRGGLGAYLEVDNDDLIDPCIGNDDIVNEPGKYLEEVRLDNNDECSIVKID